MFASQHGLDNLNLIVDNNKISMLGFTDDILSQSQLCQRLTAFGWQCEECDGHDIKAVHQAIGELKMSRTGKPKALVAHTEKGKGVPGLANTPLAHVVNPKPELIEKILRQRP